MIRAALIRRAGHPVALPLSRDAGLDHEKMTVEGYRVSEIFRIKVINILFLAIIITTTNIVT